VVARSSPPRTTVTLDGHDAPVTFLR
jgi:hypothetical protein